MDSGAAAAALVAVELRTVIKQFTRLVLFSASLTSIIDAIPLLRRPRGVSTFTVIVSFDQAIRVLVYTYLDRHRDRPQA